MTSNFGTPYSWLVSDWCTVTYDDWSDEYIWSCMMRMDGRYSGQKISDEVGEAIAWHHHYHHDAHQTQMFDWCIGVREHNSGHVETVCSHEVEDDETEVNDWRIF